MFDNNLKQIYFHCRDIESKVSNGIVYGSAYYATRFPIHMESGEYNSVPGEDQHNYLLENLNPVCHSISDLVVNNARLNTSMISVISLVPSIYFSCPCVKVDDDDKKFFDTYIDDEMEKHLIIGNFNKVSQSAIIYNHYYFVAYCGIKIEYKIDSSFLNLQKMKLGKKYSIERMLFDAFGKEFSFNPRPDFMLEFY